MLNALKFFSYLVAAYVITGLWVTFLKYYLGIFGFVIAWLPIVIVGVLTWKAYTRWYGRSPI